MCAPGASVSIDGHMKKRRRWEEELEREAERSGEPELARLDEGTRASVLQELQRAGGNRALQQVVGGPQLQREAARAGVEPSPTRPFMKIDGIPGPSRFKGHEGEFELEENYELDVKSSTDRSTGQATGKRQYSDLKVVIRKSAGVTSLRKAITGNEVIKEIVIVSALEDGLETTLLSGVRVVGVKDLGNGNVEIRFVFEKVSWEAGELTATDKWAEPAS